MNSSKSRLSFAYASPTLARRQFYKVQQSPVQGLATMAPWQAQAFAKADDPWQQTDAIIKRRHPVKFPKKIFRLPALAKP